MGGTTRATSGRAPYPPHLKFENIVFFPVKIGLLLARHVPRPLCTHACARNSRQNSSPFPSPRVSCRAVVHVQQRRPRTSSSDRLYSSSQHDAFEPMSVMPSPSALVALGPDISPGSRLSHHTPLGPAPAAGLHSIASVGGLHVASVSAMEVPLLHVLHAAKSSSPASAAPSSPLPLTSPSPSLMASSLRGGCAANRTVVRSRRPRRIRPLTRFFAPVLVW